MNYVVRHATKQTEETFHVNVMRLYSPWEDWEPAAPPDGVLRDLPQPTVTKTTIQKDDIVIVRKEGNNGELLRVAKVLEVARRHTRSSGSATTRERSSAATSRVAGLPRNEILQEDTPNKSVHTRT